MSAHHAYTPAELEGVAKALGAAVRSGDGWTCRCPAHDDRKPSLSLHVREGGRLLWRCQAGCDQDAVLEGLRKAGVLLNGDARSAEGPSPRRKAGGRGRIVARYRYVDERGALLFEVVRFEPKGFAQRRPGDKGGRLWGLGDARRVLYRLPDVLAADEVVIVEGERDADRLAGLGFVATTSPQGAGKWRPEYAEALAGKRVVVLPDNDGPGREHAETVARSLRGKAASVKVLALDGLPPKGDVSDWLGAAGHTADELRALIAAAPEWEPSPPAAGAAAPVEDGDGAPADGSTLPDGREVIRWGEERANEVAERSAAKLRDEVYMRGPMPAVVIRVEDAAAVGEDGTATVGGVSYAKGSLMLLEPSLERLQYRLNRRALFYAHNKTERAWLPKRCPTHVAAMVKNTASDLGFLPCSGIVTVPLYRNGQILAARGYDPRSKAILDFHGELPPVPATPPGRTRKRPSRGSYGRSGATSRAGRKRSGFAFAAPSARPSYPRECARRWAPAQRS